MTLNYEDLANYVDTCAGIRVRTGLEPLGGPNTKIFPPTYGVADGALKYATENRVVRGTDGETKKVESVVLSSVAQQAHVLSNALSDAVYDGFALPRIGVDFSTVEGLEDFGIHTDLEVPHRVYDAILRDSIDGDLPFRSGTIGKAITNATTKNASPLFRHAPTVALFGGWDSTGPKGGRGSKFERAITSEIVATDIAVGVKTSSRIDPLGIEIKGTKIYRTPDNSWTLDESEALKEKGKPKELKPSEINHGNVTPSIDETAGGITAGSIESTTTISFIQLRRLRFVSDADGSPLPADTRSQVGTAARATLAALGIAATALSFENGFDLRSRCVLAPTADLTFEVIARDGSITEFSISGQDALALTTEAANQTAKAGLPWRDDLHLLTPTPRLVEVVRKSRAASEAVVAAED